MLAMLMRARALRVAALLAVTTTTTTTTTAAATATRPSQPFPFPSLAIVATDQSLHAAVGIVARHVTARSGCTLSPTGRLKLTLSIDPALGSEAYNSSFDGGSIVMIVGGDRMGVVFGAGAVLRAAQFGLAGLTPPQDPPPPPPPAPPPPPVPVTDQWWAGEANHSYDYAQCEYSKYGNRGCALSPYLGTTDTFQECKALCLTTNITRCTSCGWIPNLQQWSKRCYARHDGVWDPSPVAVPGAVWARRFSIPLPPPPPPPPPLPPPPPPALRPWSAAGKPSSPGSFRGMYFATHFGNFFANAPPSEVSDYVEDMALWGANTLVVISEPARAANLSVLLPLLDRNAQIGAAASALGLKVGWIFNNEGFQSHPKNITYTRPAHEGGDFAPGQFLVCPHVGLSYLEDEVRAQLRHRF